MNPLSPSQCRGEAVCRPVEQTIRRLVGERKSAPRSTSCQIWLEEVRFSAVHSDGWVSRQEIFVPVILNGSGLSGSILHDQLMAGLLPGEKREIVAITPSGIVWRARSAPVEVSRRVSNKLRETERLAALSLLKS